ncbi:SDR family NAD(P)-dependent oxidoreductase [Streptomyces carpaticus]|uniref:SDR family NAD(P)-dependent oxidoreductase n=1 Tax=Streptomyces carpaticus TaxID=285558 RepID=UPI003D2F69E2
MPPRVPPRTGRKPAPARPARGRRGLEAAAAEVRAAGGRALVVPVDVADAAAVDAAADRVLAEYGRIDVWVNAAFSTVFGPVGRMGAAEIGRATRSPTSGPSTASRRRCAPWRTPAAAPWSRSAPR